MDTDIRRSAPASTAGTPGRTVIRRLILILLAIAAVLLATQHWTHLSPFIPYAILLACPLMHFFGHGRHGHHGKHPPGE